MICSSCGKEVKHGYGCDEDVDNVYCGDCFEKQPCVTKPHDEGCETQIFESEGDDQRV